MSFVFQLGDNSGSYGASNTASRYQVHTQTWGSLRCLTLPIIKNKTLFPHHWLQKIMKRLIKRYIIKAQADRESDEITEGKFQGWNQTYCEGSFTNLPVSLQVSWKRSNKTSPAWDTSCWRRRRRTWRRWTACWGGSEGSGPPELQRGLFSIK